MSRLQRYAELAFSWLVEDRRKPLLYFVGGVILAFAIAGGVVVHQNQVERHARNQAIALAIKVQHKDDAKAAEIGYRNQIASCNRGLSVRRDLRTYGQEFHLVGDVFVGFFGTAVRRAKAQSMDASVSPATRAAAKAALPQYSQFVATVKLLTSLPTPPAPKPCDQVITDPNAPTAPGHH